MQFGGFPSQHNNQMMGPGAPVFPQAELGEIRFNNAVNVNAA